MQEKRESFTEEEIQAIICEIFGCHSSPTEEVSLSEIYADIEKFDEVNGMPWYEWVWRAEPDSRRKSSSTLSDYCLRAMFENLPRSEWPKQRKMSEFMLAHIGLEGPVFEKIRRLSEESTLSDYCLNPMFEGKPRHHWADRRDSECSTLSNYDLYQLFEVFPRTHWKSRSNSSASTLSNYDLQNLFEDIPRSQWARRATDPEMSNPFACPLFSDIEPTTWPEHGRKRRYSEMSTLSDYGLQRLFLPNYFYDSDETLSDYCLELLFEDEMDHI